MTVQHATIEPTYVSFYAAGSLNVEIPVDFGKRGIVASDSCVNIPALYWNNGSTRVTLGPYSDIPQTRDPDFDGMIMTPARKIILFDAEVPQILAAAVSASNTRVRIWINHPTEPDDVVITFGE